MYDYARLIVGAVSQMPLRAQAERDASASGSAFGRYLLGPLFNASGDSLVVPGRRPAFQPIKVVVRSHASSDAVFS